MRLSAKKQPKSEGAKKGVDIGSILRRQGLLLMLILMIIFFRFQSPEYFLTFDNCHNS